MGELLEVWVPIDNFELSYAVSNLGRVKSINRRIVDSIGRSQLVKGMILKQFTDGDGYMYVTLSQSGTDTTKKIHRLVAEAFIPNPKNKPQVNHKDGNKHNNLVSNLEWATSKENIQHAFSLGLRSRQYEVQKCNQMSAGNCKQLICIETNQIFDSCLSASEYFNVSSSSISECVRKGWRVRKKYHLLPYVGGCV